MILRWWSEKPDGSKSDEFESEVTDRNHAVAVLAADLVETASDDFTGRVLTEFVLRNASSQDEGLGSTFHVTLS